MPTLYHGTGSRGLRALWTIEELGIPCDLVMLPAPPRKRYKAYLDINPLGTIPTYVDGDLKMTESAGIAHYLATLHSPRSLAVAVDEPEYGNFVDYLHHSDATLTFPQSVYLRYRKMEPERGLGVAGDLYADWFAARLIKVEQRLADRTYLCADRFTVADIAISYALFLARTIGLGDRLSPRLHAYLDFVTDRDGYRRARKREQDTPALPATS